MGQPIVVQRKPSSKPGVVRYETNRALTGMGHERYVAGTEVWGERPPDVLARRLLAEPSVAAVHVNANIVTIDLAKGFDDDGLDDVIENLYRFYPDPVEGEATPAPEAPAASAVEEASVEEAPEPEPES